MSPKEFERYHGGACWDYVAYQTEKLTKEGIKCYNYYMRLDNKFRKKEMLFSISFFLVLDSLKYSDNTTVTFLSV